MNTAHWHLLGTGSIGGLFALRLFDASIPVTVLLRDGQAVADWQSAGGLAITWPDGRQQQASPSAAVAGAAGAPCPHLLVATKAADTLAALAPCILGDGGGQLVVLLQNGMGVGDELRTRWPRLRLWRAVTTAGVWRQARFRLRCVAEGDTLAGRTDDAGDATLDSALAPLFAAGIFRHADDIRPVLWRKLAVNAVINALTAIHQCRNGELLRIPAAQAQLAPLAAEVETIAAADGIALGESVLDMALRVIELTAGNFSSMNRDVAAGQRTEIDYINGYLVDCAARHGIDAPLNRQLWDAVHALSRTASRAGSGQDEQTV
ncbi:MAG: ketopantoate reductase family protein [Gammaproteobacteria bacterium]